MTNIKPTAQEVVEYINFTRGHVAHVTLNLEAAQMTGKDPQGLHDIASSYIGANGKRIPIHGNKFAYNVLRGLALEKRAKIDDHIYRDYLVPSINAHRADHYHHQQWLAKSHSKDGIRIGAIDVVSALLENRYSNEGAFTPEQIKQMANTIGSTKDHHDALLWALDKVEKVDMPDFGSITLYSLPIPNLDPIVAREIQARTEETIEELILNHGYADLYYANPKTVLAESGNHKVLETVG
jgi:hypothetical protein